MIEVTVVFSPSSRVVHEQRLRLPLGSTVGDALAASGCAAWRPEGSLEPSLQAGIWGRKAPPEQVLRDGDRVEIYRALRVDPKVARRERFRRQGAGVAGLFAKRRPGGKPGY